MYDSQGRLWLTARIRPQNNPAFCKAGSNHPSAKVFPVARSGRQAEFFDPKTREIHADRSLLFDAPSAVRQRRHAVVQLGRRQQ
jgi:hypothetical protein